MSHPIPPVPILGPPRTATVPTKPKNHHVPHPPHRSHHHHFRDKSVPQSATFPTSSNPLSNANISSPFSDLLSPITKSATRHEALNEALKGREEEAKESEEKAQEESDRQRRVWADVESKRVERKKADETLVSSLSSLSALSTATTRRLDYTYYSLLSHLSSLISTLSVLSTLSTSTSTMYQSFSSTTQQLERDINGQIQTLNVITFEAQKDRAELLERKIKGARKRVDMLNGRLEGVREKVSAFEEKEKNAGRRIRFTVRCVWGLCGILVSAFVLGLVLRHWPGERERESMSIPNEVQIEEDVHLIEEGMPPVLLKDEVKVRGESLELRFEETQNMTMDWESKLRALDEL